VIKNNHTIDHLEQIMPNSSSVKKSGGNKTPHSKAIKQTTTQDFSQTSPNDLEVLRTIILGKEHDELIALKEEIKDPKKYTQSISSVISEALALRSSQDDSIAKTLAPTIEKSLTTSIINDPEPIAEALYPVMGPAIRKSISESLTQMLETFNQLLEESLSLKALKWRFDAWHTGRSYSEVILLKTLVYQVEEVFLINREDGLLLQHASLESIVIQDSDMVSGMLTAIQDFVKDSFSVESEKGSELNTLRLGDLNVIIKHGPKAILAAVVRGKLPEDIHHLFVSTLETIHQQHGEDLRNYSGDNKPFNKSQRLLQACLQAQKQEKNKSHLSLYLFIICLMASISYWSYTKYQHHQKQQLLELKAEAIKKEENLQWQGILKTLGAEPGLIVINNLQDKNEIEILRDPLARLPSQILKSQIDNENITFKTQPYLSIDDEIILLRAKSFLQTTSKTHLEIKNTILYVSGSASLKWTNNLKKSWRNIVGVSQLNIDKLTVYDKNMPIVLSLKNKIEGYKASFKNQKTSLDQANNLQIELVSNLIKKLIHLASLSNKSVKIILTGHTDNTGTERINKELALKRSTIIKNKLMSLGIPESVFINNPSKITIKRNERSVRYKINLIDIHLEDRK